MPLKDWAPQPGEMALDAQPLHPIAHLVKKGKQAHIVLTGNAHYPCVITEVFDVPTGNVLLQLEGFTVEHPSGSMRHQMPALYNADQATYGTWHWADDQTLP